MEKTTFSDAIQTNINSYRQIARLYAETHTDSNLPQFWREHLMYFTQLAEQVTREHPDLPVVELGCGPGRDALLLAQHGFHVLATDISASMLDEARRTLQGREEASHISLRQMDMRQLALPDQSCAGLWISASFLHIPKAENRIVLHECQRVLVPGGIITLLVKAADGGADERYDTSEPGGVQRFFARYQGPELWNLLEESGFMPWSMRHSLSDLNEPWLGAIAIKRSS